jgi:integrase
MISKLANGRWRVDVRTGGRGSKRVRKTFDSKTDAKRFERLILSRSDSSDLALLFGKDKRSLRELVLAWYDSHGKFLKDGERRYNHLLRMAEAFGNPVAMKVKAHYFTTYRAERFESGISPKTCNNELGYLNAVFNELYRTGEIKFQNPFAGVRPLSVPERDMGYLDGEQISQVFSEIRKSSINPHVLLVARISLETGARWSEAERLTRNRVKPYRVTFDMTKSGKVRTVPISQSLYDEIVHHLDKWGSFGTSGISAFRRAVDRCGLQLPKGQCAHILRHTFASHFIMNGGNILTLQKILGHSSVVMTMRYAHLAPDHLQDAVTLNPLSGVDSSWTRSEKTLGQKRKKRLKSGA